MLSPLDQVHMTTWAKLSVRPFTFYMTQPGVFLIAIAWWGLTLTHVPLRQGKIFAWNWYPTSDECFSSTVLIVCSCQRLAVYGIFLAIYLVTCYYNNLIIPTFLGGTRAYFESQPRSILIFSFPYASNTKGCQRYHTVSACTRANSSSSA